MTTERSLPELINAFTGLRVVVIGDVMLDEYLEGPVERISPEAPVPIVRLQQRDTRLGGAANVALNLKNLGAAVELIGLIGKDEAATALRRRLASVGIADALLVSSDQRRTTRKARVLSKGQQLLRVDTEDTHEATNDETAALRQNFVSCFERVKVDVVLFEDYDKGCLTPLLIAETIKLAKRAGSVTVVDPKHRNFWSYDGVDLFKPNLHELCVGIGQQVVPDSDSSLLEAHRLLTSRLRNRKTLVTLGSYGAYIASDANTGLLAPTIASAIVDVCGAGDSVAAVVSLALAAGARDTQLLQLANMAGALTCARVGVWPVQQKLLLDLAKLHLAK